MKNSHFEKLHGLKSVSLRGLTQMKTFVLLIIGLTLMSFPPSLSAQQPKTPADLRKLADDYYNWRNKQFPVFSSDAGLHTWDSTLTDYSLSAVLARKLYVQEVLAKV